MNDLQPSELASFVLDATVPAALHANAAADLADVLAAAAYAAHGDTGSWLPSVICAGSGQVPVWWTEHRVSDFDAAFANGILAHAQDFDSVHYIVRGHPAVALFPALLASADDSSAGPILDAYVVGVEAMATLGDALGEGLRRRGIHPTASLALIGACAALARLHRTNERQLRAAWALVDGLVSGVVSGFGTIAKPIGVGRAGRDASLAIRLATTAAAPRPLESWSGFQQLLDRDYTQPRRPPGRPWALEEIGCDYKQLPVCGYFLPTLRQVVEARKAQPLELGALERVHCELPSWIIHANTGESPKTLEEARFSFAFALALVLRFGALDIERFSEETLGDASIRRMLGRVTLVEVPLGQSIPFSAPIVLHSSDGSRETLNILHGGAAAAATAPDIAHAKLDDVLRRLGGSGFSQHFRAAFDSFTADQAPLSLVWDAMSGLDANQGN